MSMGKVDAYAMIGAGAASGLAAVLLAQLLAPKQMPAMSDSSMNSKVKALLYQMKAAKLEAFMVVAGSTVVAVLLTQLLGV